MDRLAIVGLGYVGLPLAVAFAEAGLEVVAVDVDAARVDALRRGASYISDVPSEVVAAQRHRLSPTTDHADLAECEAVVLCVPTPLTVHREPDLRALESAAFSVAATLREGRLVVLESTTYPGATRDRLVPILETSGLRAGIDFDVAFSPERVDPGRADFTIRNTPKVVGGFTARGAARAERLYRRICEQVVVVSSAEAAEMTKLLENIFRSVNIALVNEMSVVCDRMGIDIWEVVDAAATKPFGFMRFDPGPGMGGHCLPVDPFYLSWKAREFGLSTEFIELAGKVNGQMPAHCVGRIERVLNDVRKPVSGTNILLIGMSYKAGVGDARESPAVAVAEQLQRLGADLRYHDPYLPEVPELGLTSVELAPAVAAAELVAILTAHPEIDHAALAAAAPLSIDFRGVLRGQDRGASG